MSEAAKRRVWDAAGVAVPFMALLRSAGEDDFVSWKLCVVGGLRVLMIKSLAESFVAGGMTGRLAVLAVAYVGIGIAVRWLAGSGGNYAKPRI